MPTVTEAELLEEIRRALQPTVIDPAGAMTVRHLAEEMGSSVVLAREGVKRLVSQGRAECVRIPIVDLAGRRTSTWAYRLVTNGAGVLNADGEAKRIADAL